MKKKKYIARKKQTNEDVEKKQGYEWKVHAAAAQKNRMCVL
jgi:hypothetical protein